MPPPDSITSEYSVPCTRYFASPIFAASSSKTRMNSAPIALRLASGSETPREPREEALLGVDRDERHLEVVAERGDHLVALVLAHQAVVDEHAGQLVADRAVDEQRGDRRVDPAGEPADHACRRRPGARIAATCSSMIDAALQVRAQPQMSSRKVVRICCP